MSEKLHLTGDLHRDAEIALQPHMEALDAILASKEDPTGWEINPGALPDEIHHPQYEILRRRTGEDMTEAQKRYDDNMQALHDAYDNYRD